MKVCLTNLPSGIRRRLWYPIGIGYVASSLLRNSYDVEIIDCIGDNLTSEQFKKRLMDCDTNIFGIDGRIMVYNKIVEISFMIKKLYLNRFVFAGNTYTSTIPDLLLRNSVVDVCVLWEGELTTVNLMSKIPDAFMIETLNYIKPSFFQKEYLNE